MHWTDEELEIVQDGCDNEFTYDEISDVLAAQGFIRSPEAVRKLLQRARARADKHSEDNLVRGYNNTNPESLSPRILLLDIETLPIKAFTWGIYKQELSDSMIIEDWCVLSWAAKWLFEPEIMGDILSREEAVCRDDSRVINSIWELIEESDIIIAHNGNRFDIKKLNTRFILNGLTPPSPYQTIDTLLQSRKVFGFTSNKLNYLSRLLCSKEKLHTDMNLWVKCDAGDEKALKSMFRYNKQDVLLLEEVYLELRPWMKSAPNLGLYMDVDKPRCSHCGSEKLEWRGYYTTQANRFRAFRCKSCGGVGRARAGSLTKDHKANVLASLAR